MGALTKMNDLVLAERNSLSPDDDCYYLLEYTAQDNFPYSLGNSLITNLKKKTDRRRTLEWSYKEWTIQQIAAELATALPNIVDLAATSFIPIPPSKTRNNPQYDDRVLQVLRQSCPADADIREPIVCREDHASAHETGEHDRPAIDELITNYSWLETAQPLRPNIVLFDDVIASGNHFTACKRFLLQHHPATHITGIFIACVLKK